MKKSKAMKVIDSPTSPFALEAFKMYDEGAKVVEIVDYLNNNGIKTYRHQAMSINSVQRMLKNRAYIGEYHYGQHVYPDDVPQLVPTDLFERVQEKPELKSEPEPALVHEPEQDEFDFEVDIGENMENSTNLKEEPEEQPNEKSGEESASGNDEKGDTPPSFDDYISRRTRSWERAEPPSRTMSPGHPTGTKE